MTPFLFTLAAFAASAGAGLVGSLVGLGGGVIIVPILTLMLGVDIRYAIGASVVAVIATSSGTAAAYVRDRLTNIRVALFLELATVTGALSGAALTGFIQGKWLFVIFSAVMAYSALNMLRPRAALNSAPPQLSPLTRRLALAGEYYDESTQSLVRYQVHRPYFGFGLMYFAGAISGLLGIGSGALKVPAMDLAMRLPIKVSTATSNFMIGVTAAASAGVYLARGDIEPLIVAPVCLGAVAGAILGSRLFPKLSNRFIRSLFVVALLFISVQMGIRGLSE